MLRGVRLKPLIVIECLILISIRQGIDSKLLHQWLQAKTTAAKNQTVNEGRRNLILISEPGGHRGGMTRVRDRMEQVLGRLALGSYGMGQSTGCTG